MFTLFVRNTRAFGALLLSTLAISTAFSQGGSVATLISSVANSRTPSPGRFDPGGTSEPAVILARFVAAETKVREALNQHMFKRAVVLQTIGPNGEVTGEYIRNSEFVFDDRGRRIERVLFHPPSTIREMRITKEDIQDLAGSQLLGIDILETSKYRLTYAGAEAVESRLLFAIDVNPAIQPNPKRMSDRYFVGKVWVDPNTFQIVKIRGIVEPQGKQRFPRFVTWREPTKDALAFPARTETDDVLHFRNRDVHYRIKVRYYDYKLFGSRVNITEIEEPTPGINEAPPKSKEATPRANEAELKRNEEVSKLKEASPKISEQPVSHPAMPAIKPEKKPGICKTNRNAPPIGAYHWASDTEVKVYFVRNMFTSEQTGGLLEALKTWTVAEQEVGSGVRFTYSGETERRMNCRGCLTVTRRNVQARDKRLYAVFNPMKYEEGRLLVSAWIDLDFGIQDPKALQGFMAHELAHGLGLWDCHSCQKKRSLMSSFPGVNKNNGLTAPSTCDLATMKEVYREERQIAANSNGERRLETTTDSELSLSSPDLERAGFSALDTQAASNVKTLRSTFHPYNQSMPIPAEGGFALPAFRLGKSSFFVLNLLRTTIAGAAVKSVAPQSSKSFWPESTLAVPQTGFDKANFSVFDLHNRHPDGSLSFWRGLF
ncbi:MAG TPA: hypothetical protein VEW46_12140 [Pyrinomonadaceae bacterium]|nr:hypothetical protein [Pyrinomonadaceae bacterium]